MSIKIKVVLLVMLAALLSTTADAATRKLHAGHYVGMMRGNDSQSAMYKAIQPGVKGFMKRYSWRSLEPTQGNYNFAEVQADLNWASSYGMYLIVMIEDKTFVPENPVPDYLRQYTVQNNHHGYSLARWNPTVSLRMQALVKALGARFDANPRFEGIAVPESAPSMTTTQLDATGYTPEKYRDMYIAVTKAFSTAAPTSRFFWFQNYIPRNQAYIGSVLAATVGTAMVNGGPDVWPENKTLVSKSYPFYDQFKGKMPMFGQVEPVCYEILRTGAYGTGAGTKYWTMSELFNYAKTKLHVNYMIWVNVRGPSPADSYDINDAYPVIRNNPPAFNPWPY